MVLDNVIRTWLYLTKITYNTRWKC